MTTLTKDRVLIGLSNMPGDWDTCSDPTSKRPVSKRRRAANARLESIGGRLEHDDITVTRFWDEARDAAIVTQWEANQSFFDGGTLTLTSLGTDGVAMGAGKPYTYIVIECGRTGADANSSDEAKLSLVLSVTSA